MKTMCGSSNMCNVKASTNMSNVKAVISLWDSLEPMLVLLLTLILKF
jgi:hypothetical protein